MTDFKLAIRQLLKAPGFTIVAVVTLTLGIGVNTTMFSLINGILLKPLPYPRSDELVSIFENNKQQGQDLMPVNAPSFMDWKAQNSVFQNIAAYQGNGFDMTGVGDATRIFGLRASASLLETLSVTPALGRIFTTSDDVFGHDRVVLLSHRLWQEKFGGSSDILEKNVTLDGNSYSIIGVLPQQFRFAGIDADVWIPIAFEPFELENRGGHNYQAIGRLKPGVSLAQARAEMETIAGQLGQEYDLAKGWNITLVRLQDQLVGSSRTPLLILFGAVGCVLLIACANVANLLMTRASAREREFALRAALGAGRGRIIRQLLAESLALSMIGAILGTIAAAWAVTTVIKFGALPRLENVKLDTTVLWFTIALSIITSLAFGLGPALLASRVKLSDVLNDAARGSTSGKRHRIRLGFVVTQLALSLMLVIGATLLLRSFARLRSQDPGYQTDHILTAAVTMPDARFPGRDSQRIDFLNRLIERTATIPGVKSAASVMGLPLSFIGGRSAVYVEGRPAPGPTDAQAAGYTQISLDYFKTMGIPLIRGRNFESRDTTEAPFVAIVNESFVRTFFPNEEPLGKKLKVMDSKRDMPTEIVGVVRDFRQRDLTTPAAPEMYFPVKQRCWANAQIVMHTSVPPETVAPMFQKAVAEIDPEQTVFLVRTLDTIMENSVSPRRLQMLLLGTFAGLALLLSAIGIYGVMSYVVTGRTHEIGIRLSLGAQQRQILQMILRQGMWLAIVGITLGLIGAFLLTRLLQNQLFEISSTDPFTFILIPLLLATVTLMACWLPARRAAKVDPMVALRTE